MRFMGIPTYYFPTTAVFIDDRIDFLTNFSLQLKHKLALKLFSSPHQAMSYIKKADSSKHISERSVDIAQEIGGNPITNHTIRLDLSSIQDEIYNPQRFNEVAVIVVDYDMPGMNGLELCRKLEDKPIKKIMLTGKADEKVAVKAFNEGIIDHFIQKSDRHVVELVDTNILQLQRQYFLQICEEMRVLLSQELSGFNNDPAFIEFFNQVCEDNGIVEFYLTELTGSFLMLDADANPSLLVVKCYEDLNIHYEFAQDNGAPPSVLEDIRSGNKIPFAWEADDYFRMLEPEEWEQQLYPAGEIKGKEVYYYAYIKDPKNCPIDKKRIYSYNQYLQQLTHSI